MSCNGGCCPSPEPPEGLDENPSDADVERFSDATRVCPECGTTCYDDAEVCYKCGCAMSGGGSARPPIWILAGAGLALAAVLYLVFRNAF